MAYRKISELPEREYTNEEIGCSFFVDNPSDPLYKVSLNKIFEWVKEKSLTNGLTVKMVDDKIMFITK